MLGEGCNELIFNPLIQWWYKGPITKQLRTFMWSDAPIHYKIGMMSCKSKLLLLTCWTLTSLRRHVFIL